MDIKPFNTIKNFNEFKYKEKSSVFIGQVFPVENEISVNSILDEIKKKYYDASHHCYAYALIDGSYKYSDAGEPNGSAGIRINNAIQHFKLLNILVVIIRYFGGTKLGIGPLGKAYYQTAFSLLENSKIIERIPYKNVIIQTSFSAVKSVYSILSRTDSKIIKQKSGENLIIECQLKYDKIDLIKQKLIDALGAKLNFEEKDLIYL